MTQAYLSTLAGVAAAKDTTLDYGSEQDLVRRYAERRGLAPESQIVVRAGATEPRAEMPAARRSKFAGLKLKVAVPLTTYE